MDGVDQLVRSRRRGVGSHLPLPFTVPYQSITAAWLARGGAHYSYRHSGNYMHMITFGVSRYPPKCRLWRPARSPRRARTQAGSGHKLVAPGGRTPPPGSRAGRTTN